MSTIEEHVQWKPWKDGEFCSRDKASRWPNLFMSTNSLSGRLQTWRVNVSQRYKFFRKDVIGRQPKVRWSMSLTQLVACLLICLQIYLHLLNGLLMGGNYAHTPFVLSWGHECVVEISCQSKRDFMFFNYLYSTNKVGLFVFSLLWFFPL